MAQPTPSADDRFFALPTRPRSRLQATSALAGLVTAKKRSTSMNALQPTTTPIPYRSSGGGRYALLFIHGFMDAGAAGNRRSAGSTPTFRRSRSIFRAWASFAPMPGKSRSKLARQF
jgi:hypothetical protein